MSTVAEMIVKIGADISDYQRNIGQVQKSMQTIGGKMQSVGTTVGTAFTGMGVAVAGGLGMAVKTSMDFESQMSRVKGISGATAGEFDALRDSAMDLGATTSKSASEVAAGMESMAAMGYEVNEIIAAMPGIISAAEASGEDMALVADVVSSALNSFGLEASDASHVADVLAQSANQSAADINDLGYSFKYAAPVAKSLGISMEELAAATGIMADSGIKGEQAGTTLRAALLRLSDPPKEAANALEDLGVKVVDAQGNMRPFSKIIGEVGEATKGMGSAQKAAALSSIFGTEAVSGMLAVIEAGPEKLNELTNGLKSSDGAAKKTADTMKDNLKGAIEELGGAFETAQISIGTALTPALMLLAGALQGVVNWFNNLSPGMQSFLTIGTAVSALIMVLVGIVGFLVVALGALVTVEWAAIAPILAIIGAVVAVIAIITAFGVAITLAYQKIDWFRNMINTAWEFIKMVTAAAWNYIYNNIILPILTAIVTFAQEMIGKFQEFWAQHGEQIISIVQNYMSQISSTIQLVMGLIQGIFQVVWPIISGVVKIAWNLIRTIVSTGTDIILGLISAGMSLLEGDWEGAWDSIKGIAEDIWHNIESFFENIDLVQIGKDIIQGLIDGIGSMAGAVADKVASIASSIPDGVKSFLGIHSPSRLMRDEVGKMIPAGIAVGIEAETGTIEKMVNKLSGIISPELEPVGFNAHAGNIANRNKEVNPILNFAEAFSGAKFEIREETDIPKIARELYKLTKGAARRNGVVM